MKHPLIEKLSGGDFRSIGHSEEVAKSVLADSSLFAVLMSGISSDDPLIRMRAADVAEKVTRQHPDWLVQYKDKLINEIAAIDQQEVRWHAAMMITRLELTQAELGQVFEILKHWLNDKSRIVQTFSLQALADLSKQDLALRSEMKRLIEERLSPGRRQFNHAEKIVERDIQIENITARLALTANLSLTEATQSSYIQGDCFAALAMTTAYS